MAIPAPLIEIFLMEHFYRAWRGRLLTLGRQTICADADRLSEILTAYGVGWDRAAARYDRRTVQSSLSQGANYITDETLFSSFCPDVALDVLDVTDYEGANLIYNLCDRLPETLFGRFDLIFNGSVLDNIFDPAQALRNISQLLAPDGRVIHIEMASNLGFEYLIYSTDWFLDYYVMNDFVDCRVYVCTFKNVDELLYGAWTVHAYMPRPNGDATSLRELGFEQAVVVIVAEKGAQSRFDVTPVQWCYRDEAMKQEYCEKLARLDERRPVFGFGSRAAQEFSTIKRGGFYDCGIIAGR
ncbi:MAG: class I SAM-dependent methyltransferase [Stellaceae bacterium]